MHFGIDLDGVVFDYIGSFREFVSDYCDAPVEQLTDPTTWDLTEQEGWPFPNRESFLDAHQAFVRECGFLDMQVLPGADYSIRSLRDRGHRITIITSRGTCGEDPGAYSDTIRALSDNGIPYDDIFFTSQKTSLNCDVLIDDSPSNILAVGAQLGNTKALKFHTAYNGDTPCIGISSWADFTVKYNGFHIFDSFTSIAWRMESGNVNWLRA